MAWVEQVRMQGLIAEVLVGAAADELSLLLALALLLLLLPLAVVA